MAAYLQIKGEGTARNVAAARAWLKTAEAEDNRFGDLLLGLMALEGLDMRKDPASAQARLQSAADYEIDYAQYRLGLAYRDGLLGNKDWVKAATYLKRAADQGFVPAERELLALIPTKGQSSRAAQ